MHSSEIDPRIDAYDWGFDTRAEDPTERSKLEEMLMAVKAFASGILRDERPYTLSLLGQSGTGKTHLTKAMGRLFRKISTKRGGTVPWRKLCDDIRAGERGMLRDLETDHYVALDDVGSEYQAKSNYTISALDGILDARTGRRWTLITCNLSLREIAEQWDVRIASRLKRDGSVVVGVDGVSDFSFRKF